MKYFLEGAKELSLILLFICGVIGFFVGVVLLVEFGHPVAAGIVFFVVMFIVLSAIIGNSNKKRAIHHRIEEEE